MDLIQRGDSRPRRSYEGYVKPDDQRSPAASSRTPDFGTKAGHTVGTGALGVQFRYTRWYMYMYVYLFV